MFKDKQSLGVCGIEAEVLPYVRSSSEALGHLYMHFFAVGVQIIHPFDLPIRHRRTSPRLDDGFYCKALMFCVHQTVGGPYFLTAGKKAIGHFCSDWLL